MNHSHSPLQYFISRKNDLIVVSFSGALTRDSENTLKKCGEEVVPCSPKRVVLHLQGIEDRLDHLAVPAFARFTKSMREIPADLKLSSLHPILKSLLDSKGVLRSAEVAPTLEDALIGGR